MLLATRRLGLSVLALPALLWILTLSFGQMAAPMPPISIQALIDAAPDGGTVAIAAGVYYESLTVDKNLTLTGVGSAVTEIRAVPGQRVITVTSGHDLRLVNLTISGGQAAGEVGGGVKVANGSLFVEGCVISGNSADYGGGIFQEGPSNRVKLTGSRIESNGAGVDGGGVYARGEILLQQTDVLSNTAGRDGGGVYAHTGSATVTGGLFSNDRAYGGNGGALNVNNGLSIAGTRFITNSATQSGGAVLQWNSGWPVTVSDALFERNGATVQGGGLWSRGNVTVTGSTLVSNTVIISGSNTAGGGAYLAGASAYVASTTVQGNQARCQNCMTAQGGGMAFSNATVGDIRVSSFTGNYAWSGGGVSSDSTSLWVRDSVFTGNSGGYGAGLDARSANIRTSLFQSNSVVNQGGALSVGTDLSVERSRFASNSAGAGGGAIRSGGAMRAENVAFIANTATWGGSALRLENAAARSLSHLTIAMPGAASGQGIVVTAGSVSITNSIIASYTTGITASAGAAVTANGLLWTNALTRTAGSGSFSGYDEWFGSPAFAADGYHLLAGSAAIDHGVASGVGKDLDGNARPWGAGYDLGAVEYPRVRIFLPVVVRG